MIDDKYINNFARNYNLGQNKWNIWTTPPPHFNDAKMARFGSFAPLSLLWEGRGLIVPFYSVQDCRSLLFFIREIFGGVFYTDL